MTEPPGRVAVVGLGFGRTFAQMLKDHPECELICVADLNESLRAATQGRRVTSISWSSSPRSRSTVTWT